MKDLLVFVPTYNEKDNIEKLYKGILVVAPNSDILFIDDNSPDGTGLILDNISQENSNVKVIHRPQKMGIGSAHNDGISWAYNKKYKTLISMDADFTHEPKMIKELLLNSDNTDIVLGSRYLEKDGLIGWNMRRKTLTQLSHWLLKTVLNLKYDSTTAFRLYKLDKIPEDIFLLIRSKGYPFFFESLYILDCKGFSIKEIPMHLPARTYGHSKMRLKDILQAIVTLLYIYLSSFSRNSHYKRNKVVSSKYGRS